MKKPIDLSKVEVDIEILADQVEDFEHFQNEVERQETNSNIAGMKITAVIMVACLAILFMTEYHWLWFLEFYLGCILCAFYLDQVNLKNNPRKYALQKLKGKMK